MCSNNDTFGGGVLLPNHVSDHSSLSETAVLSCVWTLDDRLSDGVLSFPAGAVSQPPVASSAVQTKKEN